MTTKDFTGKWKPLIGLRMTRRDGLTDDDMDLIDDSRAWQAIKRRERCGRKWERAEESVRESERPL